MRRSLVLLSYYSCVVWALVAWTSGADCQEELTLRAAIQIGGQTNATTFSEESELLLLIEELLLDSYNALSTCVTLQQVELMKHPFGEESEEDTLLLSDRVWFVSMQGQRVVCGDSFVAPFFWNDNEDDIRKLSKDSKRGTFQFNQNNKRSLRLNMGPQGGRQSCSCNTNNCFVPTRALVLNAWNERLQQDLASVAFIDEMALLHDSTLCPSLPFFDAFAVPVLIQANVVFPPNFNIPGLEVALRQLEQDLQDGYNHINLWDYSRCDPHYRIVTHVELQVDGWIEAFQLIFNATLGGEDGTSMIAVPTDPVSIDIVAVYYGYCLNCDNRLAHDENTTPRRRQQRALQQQNYSPTPSSICLACPAGSLGPSKEELSMSINATLQTFPSLERGASLVAEATTVECSAEQTNFETNANFELIVTDAFVEEALPLLLDLTVILRNAYNQLASAYCDPFFREILNVTMSDFLLTPVPQERRVLQLDHAFNGTNTTTMNNNTMEMNNSTSSSDDDDEDEAPFFSVDFQAVVFGGCRGCGAGTTLFDDVSRRQRRSLLDTTTELRSMPATNTTTNDTTTTCLCVVNAVADRAPAKAEFVAFLLQALEGTTLFDVVTDVLALNEFNVGSTRGSE